MTNRKFLFTAALSLLVLVLLPQLSGRQNLQAQERFNFKIDPKTPLKDLLPVPPRILFPGGPVFIDDLVKVPEVHFQEADPIPRESPNQSIKKREIRKEKLLEQTALQIAKINFLNQNDPDRFLKFLLKNRPDLAGLPFKMGDACRMDKEREKYFRETVQTARAIVMKTELDELSPKIMQQVVDTVQRWAKEKNPSPAEVKMMNQAWIAAMMQMIVPESPDIYGLFVVKQLANINEKKATEALSRLALYSETKKVRLAALAILEKRPEQDVKNLLLQGLNYPWPVIAENSAWAIVHLKRTDLVPDLIHFLDQPDPRLPTFKEFKGKKMGVVRELVRINHNRNCLLCHAPGNTLDVRREALKAPVPVPGVELPSTYYQIPSPDILVRADVTYLRQDFSRMQKVADAAPWPEMQRFDFLVRTRILTDAEAKKYRAEFARVEKNSPYRRAALNALRALTGRDAEPTAAAWRKVLALAKP